MTSKTTNKVQTALNGDTATSSDTSRKHGLSVLRNAEAKALISLASDACHQTMQVGHELHSLIYDRDHTTPVARVRRLLDEALTCWQTADHYLRMLDGALEETPDQDTPDPAQAWDGPLPY